MYIKGILLKSFRNYENLEFMPSEGLNIISGDNAQGKTNLLESMFLCTFARSQRTSHDMELVMQGKDTAYVSVAFCDAKEQKRRIDMALPLRERKTIKVDGNVVSRVGDMIGVLKTIMFSPESLMLVKGAPAERRRFLDMGMSQIDTKHFFRLQKYNYALKQRNALLKQWQSEDIEQQLMPWNEILAECAAQIMLARLEYIEYIRPFVLEKYAKLAGIAESFSLTYEPSLLPISKLAGKSCKEVSEAVLQIYEDALKDDLRHGVTGRGTHKDDIALKTNGLDTRIYASQGQQRTAALALKLSELDIIYGYCGSMPIVLLDDVLSELDEYRCKALMECVSSCQCFLTTAKQVEMSKLPSGKITVYSCLAGVLTQNCDTNADTL